MGNGPQFSYLDPENPYASIRDARDARDARTRGYAEGKRMAIKMAVELFDKNCHGFGIITRIAKGEMTVDAGIRDIKNMLSAYADNINSKSD